MDSVGGTPGLNQDPGEVEARRPLLTLEQRDGSVDDFERHLAQWGAPVDARIQVDVADGVASGELNQEAKSYSVATVER